MNIVKGIEPLPETEKNIIVSAILTMREIIADIMRETNCDLQERIEKMDGIVEIFHDGEYNVLIERIKK